MPSKLDPRPFINPHDHGCHFDLHSVWHFGMWATPHHDIGPAFTLRLAAVMLETETRGKR